MLDCVLAAVLQGSSTQVPTVIVDPAALTPVTPAFPSVVYAPALTTAGFAVTYGFLKSAKAATAAVTTDVHVLPAQVN